MSENLEKRIKSRSIQKHDLEVNWNKATSFVPYKGEFIIYDIEVDEDGNNITQTVDGVEKTVYELVGRTTPYTYERIKLGDGKTKISELPFIDNPVKTEIDAIKNGETFVPVLQMGQEKSGLNFISESGKWEPNPSGNYWSGWSAVNDVLELEDGSTVTVNTWQLKGMWLYGNNYLQILITPQGIFERDLYVDSSYKRQQSKWRKYLTTTDIADALDNVVQYDSNGEINVNTHTDSYYYSLDDCLEALAEYSSNAASCMDVVVAANTAACNAYVAADEVVESVLSSNFPQDYNQIYGTDDSGNRISYPISNSYWESGVVLRESDGRIAMPDLSLYNYSGKGLLPALSSMISDNLGYYPVTVTDLEYIFSCCTTIDLNNVENVFQNSTPMVSVEDGGLGFAILAQSSNLDCEFKAYSVAPEVLSTSGEYVIVARTESGQIKVVETPENDDDATSKKYVDANFVSKTGDTITGNLSITGKLQVQGTTETVNAVTYKIENNIIEFNPNKVNNETWLTGLAINKGLDGETDLGTYGIMYDPSTDAVKLGFGQVDEENKFKFNINESAPIATREEFDDSWEEDEIFVFDKETKKFKHSGKTLSGFKKEIQDEMKSYIADYIETYMSQETIIDKNGNETLSIYGKTREVMTEDGNLWLYVGGTNEQ